MRLSGFSGPLVGSGYQKRCLGFLFAAAPVRVHLGEPTACADWMAGGVFRFAKSGRYRDSSAYNSRSCVRRIVRRLFQRFRFCWAYVRILDAGGVKIQNQLIGLTGRKGSGKSTLLVRLLRRCERVVLFDPMAEHSWCPNPVTDPEALSTFIEWSRTQQHFAARYIPQGDPAEEIDEFCFLCYRRGNLTVAVEEVSLFASAGAMPPEFGRCVRLGRHRRIDLYWTGQRFAEVPRGLTAMTDSFICFQISEPLDHDALAERIGRENADEVAGLGLYEGLLYDVQTHRAERISSRGEPRIDSSLQNAQLRKSPQAGFFAH